MKKIVIAATLLSIVTGGEVSALAAKTTPHHAVAKITHVKISKHKVTGYTTAQSHVKLMKLKHHEQAETTANKHGKFTLKVKSNNLTKLKFKLKATHAGLKARTYTHKVKKHAQSIDESTTTETQTAPAPVKPQVSDDKKPEKPAKPVKPSVSGGGYTAPAKPLTTTEHVNQLKGSLNGQLTTVDKFAKNVTATGEGSAKLNSQRSQLLTYVNKQINATVTGKVTKHDTTFTDSDKEASQNAQKVVSAMNETDYSELLNATKEIKRIVLELVPLTSFTSTNGIPNFSTAPVAP